MKKTNVQWFQKSVCDVCCGRKIRSETSLEIGEVHTDCSFCISKSNASARRQYWSLSRLNFIVPSIPQVLTIGKAYMVMA